MRKLLAGIVFMMVVSVLIGCQLEERDQREPEMSGEDEKEAESVEVNQGAKEASMLEINVIDQEGVDIGTATFKEGTDGVHIHLQAHQLSPGLHGFHIHETGLCETPNFESAGGHFNPDGKKHGFDHPEGPHAGDMENIEVEADGTVNVEVVNDQVTLQKGVANSLLQTDGTSLLIHANPDDYISQPAGNAGDKIACGVISGVEADK